MKKILPIYPSIINSLPIYGHFSSIVEPSCEACYSWIYCHFVQLYTYTFYVPEKAEAGRFVEYRIFYEAQHPYRHMDNLKNEFVTRDDYNKNWGDIISFLKYYIDQDRYIYTLCDASQISAYGLKCFWEHDPMIYGYDDEKKELYFTDNFVNGKYSKGIMSYEEMVKATLSFAQRVKEADWLHGYMCFKYEGEKKASLFDKNLYVGSLEAYMKSESLEKIINRETIMSTYENCIHGIEIYSETQKYLKIVKEAVGRLDRRAFYVLKEHKVLTDKALAYALGNDWKVRHPVEGGLLDDDIQVSTIVLNLCLKYNITKDITLLDKLANYLVRTEETESRLFPRLIDIVQKECIR